MYTGTNCLWFDLNTVYYFTLLQYFSVVAPEERISSNSNEPIHLQCNSHVEFKSVQAFKSYSQVCNTRIHVSS